MTSVVSAKNGRLLVAGAPRFNHTGKVIVFTLKNSGNLTILHSLKGHQVLYHATLNLRLSSADELLTDVVLLSAKEVCLSETRNVIKHTC